MHGQSRRLLLALGFIIDLRSLVDFRPAMARHPLRCTGQARRCCNIPGPLSKQDITGSLPKDSRCTGGMVQRSMGQALL